MKFKNLTIYSKLSLALVIYIFGAIPTYAVDSEIHIEKNNQVFINFIRSPGIEKLYDTGKLSITLASKNNIQLIKQGKKLIFTLPYALEYGTGIIDISYGDIHRSIDLTLERESESVDMKDYNISSLLYKKHLQEKALSCESSASSDIISTLLWDNISESEVISRLPKSEYYGKVALETSNGYIWGNPNQGFVGYIDNETGVIAKQKDMTGYGVYEKPIAEVYKSYDIETEIINEDFYHGDFGAKEHLTYILEQLSQKKMVQLWGDWCTNWKYEDGTIAASKLTNALALSGVSAKNECYNVEDERTLHWTYIDEKGNNINYSGLDGQHAFILLGWIGDITNPTHIRVWDTDTGFHEYEIVEWMRKWKKMSYKSIIVSK